MSLTIEVYRGAGDRPGDEIREPLLGDSLPAALARGGAELDERAHPWERVTLEMDLRQDLALGDLVRVDDPVQGATWTGRIIGIRHADDGATMTTTLDVRRPL
jgi:hypothetical protein